MDADSRAALALTGHLYLRIGQADKAEPLFAALCLIEPDEPKHQLAHACALLRQRKADAALSGLENMALQDKTGSVWHLLRAQALAQLNRQAESQAAMNRYLEARANGEAELG